MISKKMEQMVNNGSMIRAMFEEGKKMSALYGAENVYDFSLGNPSVKPPEAVTKAIIDIAGTENPFLVHGYMNNSGYEEVRETIAKHLNKQFQTNFSHKNILMTVGAAGGLNVILKTLLNPEEEVICFAPFFGEYRSYIDNFNGKLVVVPPDKETFLPDLKAFRDSITRHTKAVIINTPNNPTGVVYSEALIERISCILKEKQKEFASSIYLISDEPYRELVYNGIKVPYLTKYYENTIVCYSFSKSLSLPGERIGYLVLPEELDDFELIQRAANTATRILGFVNAPSLLQRTVARCITEKTDLEIYNKNRELLYYNLAGYGYECVPPEGAFYLFMKTLEPDDKAFAEMAKKYHILIVPGTAFDCPGYCRAAYCVDYEMIKRSLPFFEALANAYKQKK